MKIFSQKTLLLFVLLMSLSKAGEAQDTRATITSQNYLQRLEQQLAFAKELLASFPNPQAKQLIHSAQQMRDQARVALAANRLAVASAKIRSAQQLVDKAISMLVRVPLERQQERLQELLIHAERVVPASSNKEADRLLRLAVKNRRQGDQAIKKGAYRMAMESYRVATFLAERAIDLAEGPKGNLQDQIRRERERFEELLQRARSVTFASGDENANRLLRKAERQVGSIKDAISRKDFRLALSLYYSTTRLLLRVIDIAEGKHVSKRERAVDEIESLRDLISVIKDRFGNLNDRRINFLTERAERLYYQAQNDIEAQRYIKEMKKIERARNLLEQVLRKGSRSGSGLKENAERELERLRNDIMLLRERTRTKPRPVVNQLLNAAEQNVRDAEKWLSVGRTRLALEAILSGNRLVLAAENTKRTKGGIINVDKIRKELDKLDRALSQAKSEPKTRSEIAKGLVKQAEEMRNRAFTAFEKRQLRLAHEYIQIANELIAKSLREVQ